MAGCPNLWAFRFFNYSCVSPRCKTQTRKCLHAIRKLSSVSGDVEYDYVVVGAGSAGCVVANRLVLSDNKTRVFVTEAGPAIDTSWKVRMPSGIGFCIGNKEFDWCYETEPQKHLNGRKVFWPRGKGIGGSSCLNAMVYVRGHPADYDRWAFEEGATGWSYVECLPYFSRSQKHELGANEYRGSTGPLGVMRGPSKNPLYDAFIDAGRQAGYPVTDDFNGAQPEGFGRLDFTISNGQRASTAAAYLRPAMKEAGSRLTVSTDTLVHRVLFNGKRAVGVEFQTNGKGTPLKRAYASKEVILCGGAINSPHLLMLSGIGPAAELRRHNIQLVQHSPGVGSNLQDHIQLQIQYRCTQPVSFNASQLPHKAIPDALQWFLTKSGQHATFELQGGAFVRSRPDVEHADVQLLFFPAVLSSMVGIKFKVLHGFQVGIYPLRPKSRGTVIIRSADPYEYPIIDPNYLEKVEDVREMRNTVHIARQVIAQRAFDGYRGDELSPGTACQSDDEIDAFVRDTCGTCYHPTSTCRMGSPGSSENVVVDTACRVVGVEGLRVVDASVLPSMTSGNTNAPVIMVAEKASDLILGKPPLPKSNVSNWKMR